METLSATPALSRPAALPAAGGPGKARQALQRLARGAFALLVVGLAWEAVVRLFHLPAHILPRLSVVLAGIAATPQAYVDGFIRTCEEALLGFLAGTAFGVFTAISFFKRPALKDLIFPIFIVSQTIPVIAFGALVVLWFGNTLLAKAVIAFYVTFFPVTINTLLGLKSVDPQQIQLMRSFGATRRKILWTIQMPAALPQMFVALRLGASLSLVGAIVGEWFGDTTGLGVLLLQAMYNENQPALWAALLVCAVLGTALYAAVAWVESKVVFWSGAA